MKIAVIGANGKAGQWIVQAALERGLEVSAIVRGVNRSMSESVILKDVFALKYEDLETFDVIVDALGFWERETLGMHMSSLQHLSGILKGHHNRLIVVGGAGSLFMDDAHTQVLSDTVDFPEAFKPLAKAMGEGLDYLRTQDDVQWTYLSPAADFQSDGIQSGQYTMAGENFSVNANGESWISYADYASALIDEIEHPKAIQKRISVIAS